MSAHTHTPFTHTPFTIRHGTPSLLHGAPNVVDARVVSAAHYTHTVNTRDWMLPITNDEYIRITKIRNLLDGDNACSTSIL